MCLLAPARRPQAQRVLTAPSEEESCKPAMYRGIRKAARSKADTQAHFKHSDAGSLGWDPEIAF